MDCNHYSGRTLSPGGKVRILRWVHYHINIKFISKERTSISNYTTLLEICLYEYVTSAVLTIQNLNFDLDVGYSTVGRSTSAVQCIQVWTVGIMAANIMMSTWKKRAATWSRDLSILLPTFQYRMLIRMATERCAANRDRVRLCATKYSKCPRP